MSVVDGSEAVVEDAEEEVEEADVVEVEVVVLEAGAEVEDAFWMSMLNASLPVYDCTFLSPDVLVDRSLLGMV